MKVNNNSLQNSSLINIHDTDWLNKQRIAGQIVAGALEKLQGYCHSKTFHSMATLDYVIEQYIIQSGGMPTFKGYKGFPNACCISINKKLVHGIPNDTVLDDGDLVSFDLGVTYQGAIADSALTCIFGSPKNLQHVNLVQATEEALSCAIQSIAIGKRLGCIGNAIYKCGKKYGLSIVTNYGGHGIDMTYDGVGIPHAAPFIANRAELNEGVRIEPGMALAIEPLFVIGSSNKTRLLNDNWTVVCDDLCSHHEHSIFVHKDHVEVITYRASENYLKSNKVYF